MTKYQTAKTYLKEVADQVKKEHPNDKPLCRQVINDTMDSYCKEHDLAEHERDLLANYACKLHPQETKYA